MFSPAYRHVAAELSPEEEKVGIQILEANYRKLSIPQLMELLSKEFPLCLASDLSELVHKFLSSASIAAHPLPKKRALEEEPVQQVPMQRQTTMYPPPPNARILPGIPSLAQNTQIPNYILNSSSPSPKKSRVEDTEDPVLNLSSKWSQEETDELCAYLAETQGRKNWISCARRVRTKSSAQCKAKFNNMRAQELNRTSFEI
ncbi:hypothetical protein H4R20_003523 [Coemansia guatemalensis]|uniref:Myb-like domain-containing protein n=1 Tax=Coemansia guatemalensis TaxID=2761395 RepID=A0A9W8I1M8_9FUNG|nr:hypothetical protein H4R20_003523 [Coemansia guatemalensis]